MQFRSEEEGFIESSEDVRRESRYYTVLATSRHFRLYMYCVGSGGFAYLKEWLWWIGMITSKMISHVERSDVFGSPSFLVM